MPFGDHKDSTQKHQAPATKTVSGVKVFESGTWVDSAGNVRDWTDDDINNMARAYADGLNNVPLKCGHTSDAFNRKIAEALGMPLEMVTGDETGNGQMALGKVVALRSYEGRLLAAFGGVPEKVADLIEAGLYNSVSAEIEDSEKYGAVLTGVALLGAEEPALPTRESVEAALVFGLRDRAGTVHVFSKAKPKEEVMKPEEITRLLTELGLKEDAKPEMVFAAVAKLKEAVKIPPDNPDKAEFSRISAELAALKAKAADKAPADNSDKAEFARINSEFAALKADNAALKADNAALKARVDTAESEKRVAKYTRMAEGWSAIAGKPEDIGKEMAELETKAGAEIAAKVVASYQKANDAAAAALKVTGTAKPGNAGNDVAANHAFAKKVQAVADAKKITFQQALVEVAEADKKGFAEYNRAVNEAA